MRGVEGECAEHGTGVVVSLLRDDDARPPSWQNLPALHHSDGVILVTSRMTRRQREQLERAGVALVLVDPVNLPDTDIASVGATNWVGGLAATEHLIELGHRRIAMVGGPADMLCTQARVDGYRTALERAGIEVDKDLVRYGDFHHQGGFARTRELLELPTRRPRSSRAATSRPWAPTRRPGSLGLRIPEDLSVVGFDDLPTCEWLSPPLTTVRQPLEEMGRVAARTLLQLLDGRPRCPPRGAGHRPACPRLHRPAAPRRNDDRSRPGRERDTQALAGPGSPAAERVADLLARMTPEEKAGSSPGSGRCPPNRASPSPRWRTTRTRPPRPWTRSSSGASASSPACSGPRPSRPPRAPPGCASCSAWSPPTTGSASRRSRTRSASTAS